MEADKEDKAASQTIREWLRCLNGPNQPEV